jgi:histidyl-tRNA synthetase
VSTFARPKKLGKFLSKLEAQGYNGYAVFEEEDGIKMFDE